MQEHGRRPENGRAEEEVLAMSDVLTELDQATPEWLTMILRQGAYLPPGQVVAAEPTPVNASSDVAHLRLRYSADAPTDAPAHLLLKITWRSWSSVCPSAIKKRSPFIRRWAMPRAIPSWCAATLPIMS